MDIKSAAVIGSGVMGGGIAAHIANAGIPVLLLDIVPDAAKAEGGDRSAVAKAALDRLVKAEPAAFMHRRNAKLVTPGNIEDDLGKLAEVDWIIEAVVENPAVKADLYRKVDAVRKPGSVVSSNTSTIPLTALVAGQSDAFARDFLVTHFFNPPRYMRLLEVVAGERTRPEAVAAVSRFADVRLGKGVVACKDRPGFIANRIGTFWIQSAVNAAFDFGLTVEEADAVLGRPMGIPKTGVFGLLDLVGLDLMPHVAKSLLATLPPDDAYRAIHRDPELFGRMIADGYTGRKGKGGFYRVNKAGGGRVKEAIDLATGSYRPTVKPALASLDAARAGLPALVAHPDKGGRCARRVLLETLSYAAGLVPEIADDIVAVDQAMRLGYNWTYGPFELIDRLGADWLAAALDEAGRPVPTLLRTAAGRTFYRVEDGRLQYLTLDGAYADVRAAGRRAAPLGHQARLRAGREERLGGAVGHRRRRAVPGVHRQDERARHRRHGAARAHHRPDRRRPGSLEGAGRPQRGRQLLGRRQPRAGPVRRERRDVVRGRADRRAGPAGLQGAQVRAVPGGRRAGGDGARRRLRDPAALRPRPGACRNLHGPGRGRRRPDPRLGRLQGDAAPSHGRAEAPRAVPCRPIAPAFETISTAKVAKSAEEARDLKLLRVGDGITMNRDRLLADAKAKALELASSYAPPKPVELRLPGPTARVALDLAVQGFRATGKATAHDAVVAGELAKVLSGGDTDITAALGEDDLLALERRHFLALLRTPGTVARIEHMLATGKPLRN